MSGRLRSGPVPVVYDTDIGDNVDDALALVLALASPEIALTAVSVEATGHPEVARRLLDAAGRSEVPVTVAPPLGDGVHLVATGPFTNVADALRADPAMAARLDGITVMGGMVDAGRFPP
jgi:inosine-uridine nucleoside N-ribohydrolase